MIRKKSEIPMWLEQMERFSGFDKEGKKHYFVFDDKFRDGIITIMKYENKTFTYHGKGEHYCDDSEIGLEEKEWIDFVWEHRKNINQALKARTVET